MFFAKIFSVLFYYRNSDVFHGDDDHIFKINTNRINNSDEANNCSVLLKGVICLMRLME